MPPDASARGGRGGGGQKGGGGRGGRVRTSSSCPGLAVLILAGLLLRRGQLEGECCGEKGVDEKAERTRRRMLWPTTHCCCCCRPAGSDSVGLNTAKSECVGRLDRPDHQISGQKHRRIAAAKPPCSLAASLAYFPSSGTAVDGYTRCTERGR